MIPAQLLMRYSEYVPTSSADFLSLWELSRRESKNACAVVGDVSWCSSAAVYMAATDALLAYHAS